MAVLFFSDIHLHPFKQFAKQEKGGVNSRLLDGFSILDQIASIVESREDIHDVVFCGDLFHVRNNINITTFNLVVDRIVAFSNRVRNNFVLLAGNHDQGNRAGDITSLDVFRHVKTEHNTLQVITEPCEGGLASGASCVFVPYTEDVEKVTKVIKKAKNPDILIAHAGLNGCDLGADFVYKNEADWDLDKLQADKFACGFFGHFHKHQTIRDNFMYVGAPMHHNFGDIGQDRGCVVLNDDGTTSFIKLKYPEFRVVNSIEDTEDEPWHFYKLIVDESFDLTDARITSNVDVVRIEKEKEAVSKPLTFNEAIEEYVNNVVNDKEINKSQLRAYIDKYMNTVQ